MGDLIVDQYVATEPIGVVEAHTVVKELEEQLRAHRCIQCCFTVKELIVTGDDSGKLAMETLKERGVQTTAFVDENRPTTFKKRYLVSKRYLERVDC